MTPIREYWKKRKVKDLTVKSYMTILKKCNGGEEPKTVDFLNQYEKVMARVEKNALSTQRTYLICIVSLLQSTNKMDEEKDLYYNKLQELEYIHKQNCDSYEKTPKEEERMCSLEELKLCADYWFDVLDEVIYNNYSYSKVENIYKMTLISLLYTEIPPIRLEWASFKFIHSEDDMLEDGNYILERDGQLEFILMKYKTDKHYRTKVFHPTPVLDTIIRDWMSFNNSNYLFPDRTDPEKPMTQNAFGKLIPKAFESTDKKITLNILRHIWVSENVDADILEKNAKLADAMCHSSRLQKEYIRK